LTLGRLRQPSKRRRQEFEPSIHELLRSERIQTCNALDTGLFVCAPALFAALDVSTASEDTTLSGGIRQLAVRGLVRAFEIGDASWYDIDTIADLQAAESRLTSVWPRIAPATTSGRVPATTRQNHRRIPETTRHTARPRSRQAPRPVAPPDITLGASRAEHV
jgi:NDP-sugar pyrophosphorylase family protein